jgi:mono/diheme cytochrome c family protein
VLYGLPATGATSTPIMPGFAAAMNDAQLVALARYLRSRFTDKKPWNDIEKSLHEARTASTRPAPSERSTPPGAMGAQNEAQR